MEIACVMLEVQREVQVAGRRRRTVGRDLDVFTGLMWSHRRRAGCGSTILLGSAITSRWRWRLATGNQEQNSQQEQACATRRGTPLLPESRFDLHDARVPGGRQSGEVYLCPSADRLRKSIAPVAKSYIPPTI